MKEKEKLYFDERAKMIKAMAHPTRLYILTKLKEAEHCVCELTEMLGFDASTISKHLSVLKNAGLVSDDKRGLNVYYRLENPCILDILECVDSAIRKKLKSQMNMLK